MPLSQKGQKIMRAMQHQYGTKRGKSVFYASMNKGKITGVERSKSRGKHSKMRRKS